MKKLFFERPMVMGIVNITPDSFFDGGLYFNKQDALAHARELADAGADILDIGAASSRPGYTPLSAGQELDRLSPLLDILPGDELPPLSIDTDKPEVAKAALEYGFTIINNSGLPTPEMSLVAAAYDSYLVLMFRGPFAKGDIISQMKSFFERNIEMAVSQGVPFDKLILDPGIGFDMDMEQCRRLVAHTADFLEFGRPLLLGMSNKRFIGALGGGEAGQRGPGNIASELFAVSRGAGIIRVHDVAASVQALKIFGSLMKGAEE